MTGKSKVQKTLIIFKPDAVQRGLVGEILSRFEKVGLKIVGMRMEAPSMERFHYHYEDIGKVISRRGEKVFKINADYMMQGPVILAVLEGVDAVELVRKMVGTTEPKSAMPGTIRGDYSHIGFEYADATGKSTANLIHASGDVDDAEKEVAYWFSESELHDYSAMHEKFTR